MKIPLYNDLTLVFRFNSLKNLATIKNNPMPHSGNEFFIWCEFYDDSELSEYLRKGNLFRVGHNSINSYISLQDYVYENDYYCIERGPQSNSSSNTVRFIKLDDKIRIIANGWGNSYICLWEGSPDELLQYLKQNQPR